MRHSTLFGTLVLTTLAGCASLNPPDGAKLAALPVVAYPDTPPAGDYVFKLPAGQPIAVNIHADGTALAANATQTLRASLARDIYLHKDWASEDGLHWLRADKLIAVNLKILLPSYETPGPGTIHLTVDRKDPR
ncbi:MAG: hypothetical protein AB1899_02960 [Pseudomonadota bacterium]